MTAIKRQFLVNDADSTDATDHADLPFVVGVDNALIRLHLYYRSLFAQPLPSVRDVGLMDFSKTGVLGYAHVVNVENDNPDGYRFEFYGSSSTVSGGGDFTKKHVGEIPLLGYREFVAESYAFVKSTGAPLLSSVQTVQSDYRRSYRRLMLPLADDFRNVSHVLVASIPDRADILLHLSDNLISRNVNDMND